MLLLQLCNKLPFPANDGGAIAMNNLTMGLLDCGIKVKVFALVTPKTINSFKQIPESYKQKTSLVAPFIDTSIKPIDAFFNLFSSASYNLKRFYSKEVEDELIKVLQKDKYDIVQLESIFVSAYIPVIRKYSKAKIVLRAHNVEHQLWKRLSKSEQNPLKKWYLRMMSERLKIEELEGYQKVDGIATITPEDKKTILGFGIDKPIDVVPFGLNINEIVPFVKASNDVFHLGSMDWMPNLEGINWLLEKVLPEVKGVDYKLHLAGKNMPADLLSKSSDIIQVQDAVPDGLGFMREKSIMVVPLLSGGGMRVKIVEGMALGKAIISTTVGAEGISCEDGKNILIADTPQDFAHAIERCVNDSELCKKLGENARKLAEERYDNSVITKQLIAFYSNLV